MPKRVSEKLFDDSMLKLHFLLGFIIRLTLVAYSRVHDSLFQLKYTDIDYTVYTDAAERIVEGGSPYDRDTYRYTPLLTIALIPNVAFHTDFGKILFVVFDMLICCMIYKIVLLNTKDRKLSFQSTLLWLYNPLPVGICTRGSSESIIVFLVLTTLYCVKSGKYVKAGLVHGFAVHFKIYPLVYSPLLLLSLRSGKFQITKRQVELVIGSAVSFLLATTVSYYLYGWKFLDETYLYHIYRQDFKHNFSLFWYLMYLTEGSPSYFLGYVPFIAQVLAVSLLSVKYKELDSLEFGVFSTVLAFVTLNKVVTSQYFLWYLSLLPLIWYRFEISPKKAVVLGCMWYLSQGAFLLPAYLLEFREMPVHFWVSLGCLTFFLCNCAVLVTLMKAFKGRKKLKV